MAVKKKAAKKTSKKREKKPVYTEHEIVIRIAALGPYLFASTSRGLMVDQLPAFADHETAKEAAEYLGLIYEGEGRKVKIETREAL